MKAVKIDDKDIKILNELQRDSKQTLKSLAKKAGLPPSTLHLRLHRLEKEKIIQFYTIVPDLEKLHRNSTVFALLGLSDRESSERFEHKALAHAISQNRHVAESYLVAGEWDLLIKLKGDTTEQLLNELIKIRKTFGITRAITYVCFEELKFTHAIELT